MEQQKSSLFEFSIKSILLYNPELLPLMKKPLETDYQDAKILYYYPEDTIIHEKRNQQGLTEGNIQFWQTFDTEKKQENKQNFSFLQQQDYTHMIAELEENMFICIVIDNNHEQIFTEYICQKFVNHFYKSFFMFYGKFTDYFNEDKKLNDIFQEIFYNFIRNYIMLNRCDNSKDKINILKYSFQGLNYVPIENKNFLALQYLQNIINTIDNDIEHYALFYNGYFIYSSLAYEEVQFLYDYFYVTNTSMEINTNNKLNRFISFNTQNKNNTYGYCLSTQNGFIYGPLLKMEELQQLEPIEEQYQQLIDQLGYFSPEIRFKDQNQQIKKYAMNGFTNGKLIMLFFKNANKEQKFNKLYEINQTLQKNSEKIRINLEKQIKIVQSIEESYQMVYFNQMNLAIKSSNRFILFNDKTGIDNEILQGLMTIQEYLQNETAQEKVIRLTNYQIIGVKKNYRIIVIILSNTISLNKIDEEKQKIMKFYFNNIFLN